MARAYMRSARGVVNVLGENPIASGTIVRRYGLNPNDVLDNVAYARAHNTTTRGSCCLRRRP